MENNKLSRIPFIDVVKAIAMISVVSFHACTNQSSTYLATNAFLIRFLSAFAMPVFFFVNGFLYKNKNPEHPIKEIIRKVKSYYLPFLAYNLFYLVFHNLFVYLHMVDARYGNSYYDVMDYVQHFILAITGHREFFSGALWFLGSILIINTILILTEFISLKLWKGEHRLCVLGGVTIILLIAGYSGYVPESMKLADSCRNMIYFFFGMVYRQKEWNRFLTNKKAVFIGIGVIVNLLISYNKLYNPMNIAHFLPFVILDYLNAFLGIVAVMLIAQISWVQNSKLLNIIGKNTMDIMGLHFMVFKVVSVIMILYYSLPITRLAEYPVLIGIGGAWWILYTIVGVSVPTLFSIIRHKIGKGKKV